MIKNAKIVTKTVASPLGTIRLAADSLGLCGLWFEGQRYQNPPGAWHVTSAHPVLDLACSQLGEYFQKQRKLFQLPLSFALGTEFQRLVWQALLGLSYGQTSSYGNLSATMGREKSVRAVANAIAHNPLSIVVPCHRVLDAKGALHGYAGGLERKAALLQLEGAV